MIEGSSGKLEVKECLRLYSIHDARSMLGGIGRTWLYGQIKTGNIRPVKLGRRTMIRQEDILKLAKVGQVREG